MQMKKVRLTNKPGLYTKFLLRLAELEKETPTNSRKSYLTFEQVRSKICRNFSIPDEEVLNHLRFFEEFGYIEFVRFRGIRLKFEVVQ